MTAKILHAIRICNYIHPDGCLCLAAVYGKELIVDELIAALDKSVQVWACFELDGCDAPILRAIKTTERALEWRNADMANRFIVPFTLDHERVAPVEPCTEWIRGWEVDDGI